MKQLRTKLLAAVAMLAIAAIMMTTASYAWFTISTNPEISDISAQITANGNLEIQLAKNTTVGTVLGSVDPSAPVASAVGDAGKNQTWGNLIDLEEYFTTTENVITLKPVYAAVANNSAASGLIPATADGDSKYLQFWAPSFALDGRIKSLGALTRTNAVASTTSNIFNDYQGGVYTFNGDAAAFDENNEKAWCFEIDFWIRTNVDGAVAVLSAPTFRDSNTPTGSAENGLGSYIDYTGNSMKDLVTIKVIEYNVPQTVTTSDGVQVKYVAGTTAGTGETLLSTLTESNGENATVHDVTIYNKSGNKYTLGLGNLSIKGEDDNFVLDYGTADSDAEKAAIADNGIKLSKNVYKLVKVYVYMDGANMTNADFLNSVASFAMNIQFKLVHAAAGEAGSGIVKGDDYALNDMKPTQTQYSANAANTTNPDAAKRP